MFKSKIVIRAFSIAASLLLMFPYAVKFEHTHHHHHFYSSHADKDCEKQSENLQDDCLVCHFEYSTFLNTASAPLIEKIQIISSYYIFPRQFHLFSIHPYSFQLRAPPAIF